MSEELEPRQESFGPKKRDIQDKHLKRIEGVMRCGKYRQHLGNYRFPVIFDLAGPDYRYDTWLPLLSPTGRYISVEEDKKNTLPQQMTAWAKLDLELRQRVLQPRAGDIWQAIPNELIGRIGRPPGVLAILDFYGTPWKCKERPFSTVELLAGLLSSLPASTPYFFTQITHSYDRKTDRHKMMRFFYQEVPAVFKKYGWKSLSTTPDIQPYGDSMAMVAGLYCYSKENINALQDLQP